MMEYVAGGLGVVALCAGGAAYVQTSRIENIQVEKALVSAELQTCGGRLGAILRDVESDNEIDNLNLVEFDLPPEWMRGEAPGDP